MSYHSLWKKGILANRVKQALERYQSCDLCPHECEVDRTRGQKGKCRAGWQREIASYGPHFGEEGPLVGRCGSGAIFFTHCPLKCLFCQNYSISQLGQGQEVDSGQLADIMLDLARRGCHNINLVSPTQYVPGILQSLETACSQGLNLPLVYNTGGYESLDTLRLLDGVVDIYMPDLKYGASETSLELAGASLYPQVAQAALLEMHRQVGDLELDQSGLAWRGLLVRHLVLPGDLAQTDQLMAFIAEKVSRHTYINVMAQYYPSFRAHQRPPLDRRVQAEEVSKAREMARAAGLYRLDPG